MKDTEYNQVTNNKFLRNKGDVVKKKKKARGEG